MARGGKTDSASVLAAAVTDDTAVNNGGAAAANLSASGFLPKEGRSECVGGNLVADLSHIRLVLASSPGQLEV